MSGLNVKSLLEIISNGIRIMSERKKASNKQIVQLEQLGRQSFRSRRNFESRCLIKHAKSPSQYQPTKYYLMIPRHRVEELRGLVMRCFDGGGLGLFLGNTLGNEDTKVEKIEIIIIKGLERLNILVFCLLLLLVIQFTFLKSIQVTTTLKTEWCNESLNLRTRGRFSNCIA